MEDLDIPFGYELIENAPKFLVGDSIASQEMAKIALIEKIKLGSLKFKLYVLPEKNMKLYPPILIIAKDFIDSRDLDTSFISSDGWTLWNKNENNQKCYIGDVSLSSGLENPSKSLFSQNQQLSAIYERVYGLVIIEVESLNNFKHIAIPELGLASTKIREHLSSTGLPGRPTPWHLVKKYFEERMKKKECEKMISHEARHLSKWLKENHPNEKPLKAEGIGNNIREDYNIHKNKMLKSGDW